MNTEVLRIGASRKRDAPKLRMTTTEGFCCAISRLERVRAFLT